MPPTPRPRWALPLGVALGVTATVSALSWFLPSRYAATGVGLAFLGATWLLVLRHDEVAIARHGLSMGGLFEPGKISPRRLGRDAARALLLVVAVSLVVFPPFARGYPVYWARAVGRALPWLGHPILVPKHFLDDALGQLLVIALPEEAFYRGYLQTALDGVWTRRVRVLGADLGVSLIVTSAVFAVGHWLTDPHPSRLAVFFPSLLFGFMRARSGGIGASVVFHAMCNLAVTVLGTNVGLIR